MGLLYRDQIKDSGLSGRGSERKNSKREKERRYMYISIHLFSPKKKKEHSFFLFFFLKSCLTSIYNLSVMTDLPDL